MACLVKVSYKPLSYKKSVSVNQLRHYANLYGGGSSSRKIFIFVKNLYNLEYLVIDCLRKNKHPSHFNYDQALELIKIVKPKNAILTNLHTDLDYDYLKKKLPSNILPAYDGLSFNF